MINNHEIPEPIKRNKLRRTLGKEYFILKRRWQDQSKDRVFAKSFVESDLSTPLVTHQSHILRPLKNVDMYLQHNKAVNLQLAIEKLNGICIKPNEIFSFWNLVGRPTKKQGYLDGLVLQDGTISKGVGGGLCQLGNLLFWMFLHTSLTVSERWRHSYDVFPDINRTLPFGSGATLSYNYIDLRAVNSTEQSYQLKLWISDDMLHGKILSEQNEPCSFEIHESGHLIKKQWWGGYTRHNQIWQHRTYRGNPTIEKTLVTENHAIMMYSPLLEQKSNIQESQK